MGGPGKSHHWAVTLASISLFKLVQIVLKMKYHLCSTVVVSTLLPGSLGSEFSLSAVSCIWGPKEEGSTEGRSMGESGAGNWKPGLGGRT